MHQQYFFGLKKTGQDTAKQYVLILDDATRLIGKRKKENE